MTNWPRCRSCNRLLLTLSEGPRCLDCREKRRVLLWVGILTLGFLILCARARGGVVTEEFLDKVAWTESRNNPKAVGRHGEHTAFQMKQCAIDDTCKYFGWPHRLSSSLTPSEARAFARGFCLILENRMTRVGFGQPSEAELYRAWRLGLSGYQRSNGSGLPASDRGSTPVKPSAGASGGAISPRLKD